MPGEEGDPPERIWYVDREPNGWSEPQMIDGGPNTLDLHWEFSVAADGSIYVGSRGDVYLSRYVNGHYAEPAPLGRQVNSDAQESMPFIARDGSYLLFARFGHPDNHDFMDVWISYADEHGAWMAPVNLGERINSVAGICPVVSPDGRYLFFNGGNNDNYWVDAEVIDRLRTEQETGGRS